MRAPYASSSDGGASADVSDVARAFEPERYLAATLAADPEREASIALAAFAADLQRIAMTSTQPMLGEIRLQWWRDTLDSMAKGGRTGSPIADALGAAVERFDLPLPMLVAMTEARAFDLYDDPMPDQASLDGYLSKTEAAPFELALRVAGASPADAAALSQPAGKVFGTTRLLARLPVHAVHGRTMLPGVEMSTPSDRVAQYSHLISAGFASLEPQFRRLPRPQRCALLPLAVVPSYVRALLRRGRDPQRVIADIAPLTRVWRIGLAHAMGRI